MGRRNWSSRFLDAVQWEEFYNTEKELLFPVCEHQWSRNTSPRLLVSSLNLHRGVQKVSFLITLARANTGIQKLVRASLREEGSEELAPWADGVTCLPQRIPLSLPTQSPLSESKLTKQEHFLLLGLLRTGHVFTFKGPHHVSLCHLPALSFICILNICKGNRRQVYKGSLVACKKTMDKSPHAELAFFPQLQIPASFLNQLHYWRENTVFNPRCDIAISS